MFSAVFQMYSTNSVFLCIGIWEAGSNTTWPLEQTVLSGLPFHFRDWSNLSLFELIWKLFSVSSACLFQVAAKCPFCWTFQVYGKESLLVLAIKWALDSISLPSVLEANVSFLIFSFSHVKPQSQLLLCYWCPTQARHMVGAP